MHLCIVSLADNNTFLAFNRDPVDSMIRCALLACGLRTSASFTWSHLISCSPASIQHQVQMCPST